MATYVPPQKNVEFIFYVGLVSQADTKLLQNNPTLAAGDVLVSTDGGATSNLDTLPAVTPASSDMVKVTVSTTEMNGDNIIIVFSDVAGSEWCDLLINIQTAAQSLDTMDTNIDDIETDTAVIGALGAGLTAIPWNANWDTEVESEVTDSLVVHNLDHLCKTATAGADMTTEVPDNTILSRILASGDTSAFDPTTDSLQDNRDRRTGPTKNTALSNFTFVMRLSLDHVSVATGKTVTAQISKDGAAFANSTNSATELSNGVYDIDLTATEMNADVVTLKFTETDCDATLITILTST